MSTTNNETVSAYTVNYDKKSKIYTKNPYHDPYKIWLTKKYSGMVTSSEKRGHVPPNFTKAELDKWVKKQPNYKVLFKAWEDSGYVRELVPSIDRFDSNKPYRLDTVKLVSFKTNSINYILEKKRKLGLNILQYTLTGNFVKLHPVLFRIDENGFTSNGVARALTRDNHRYMNYLWFYQDEFSKEQLNAAIEIITSKRISSYTTDGKYLKTYANINAVIEEEKLVLTSVNACLRGARVTTGKRFWIYDNTPDIDSAIKALIHKNTYKRLDNIAKDSVLIYDQYGTLVTRAKDAIDAARILGTTSGAIREGLTERKLTVKGKIVVNSTRDDIRDFVIKRMYKGVVKLDLKGTMVTKFKSIQDAARHIERSNKFMKKMLDSEVAVYEGYIYRYTDNSLLYSVHNNK